MNARPTCHASERGDWLRLIRSEHVGPATFWSLLERYRTATNALEAVPELSRRGGARRPMRLAAVEDVRREVQAANRAGARHIFYGMADYPRALSAIASPPPVIMVRGDAALLARRAVAVVGSRKASAAGRAMARDLAAAFAAADFVVVSGLALGIDTEAHRAALPNTVAVVAGGVDKPTPEENAGLAAQIAGSGAIVSEMPFGFSPYARDFPRRNRLIAGLSEAVVIVEAAASSGALYTARYAADEGREVFAVPGSPKDPRAAGCLALLRDGAGLVVEASDVLNALRPAHGEPVSPDPNEDGERMPHADPPAELGERVASLLSISPVPVDEIVRACGAPTGEVLAAILELELSGRAEREADGRVRAAVAG